ncbi:hypothetical protein GWK47_051013 [Chionoecetes opilio]|uniref:Uncharacterized protein n=1 Tax=Chionoecetes opilio TaxID=41210 RepID=A0A8J4Y9I0_CHIOP|nr:hypothetical protein GWK47_051013 [Chionoecetes opilio]
MSVCEGCDIGYQEFLCLLQDEDKIQDFVLAHKLIKSHLDCGKCGIELPFKNYAFRCCKQRTLLVEGKKVIHRCSFFQSALKDTWFSRSHVTIKDILILSRMWSRVGCNLSDCEKAVSCTAKPIIERLNLCREVAFDYCVKKSVKLGGVGKVVELYIARFSKGNYGLNRIVDDRVCVGAVEIGSRDIFLTTVDKFDEETAISVIQENVLRGSHIVTECWYYENLEHYGYQLSRLEPTKKISELESASESVSNSAPKPSKIQKVQVPVHRQRRIHIGGCLAESLFKWRFPDEGERFHAFLMHVAYMYYS